MALEISRNEEKQLELDSRTPRTHGTGLCVVCGVWVCVWVGGSVDFPSHEAGADLRSWISDEICSSEATPSGATLVLGLNSRVEFLKSAL
jgi:hypothetical protein